MILINIHFNNNNPWYQYLEIACFLVCLSSKQTFVDALPFPVARDHLTLFQASLSTSNLESIHAISFV